MVDVAVMVVGEGRTKPEIRSTQSFAVLPRVGEYIESNDEIPCAFRVVAMLYPNKGTSAAAIAYVTNSGSTPDLVSKLCENANLEIAI